MTAEIQAIKETKQDYLSFLIGKSRIAVPIEYCREVNKSIKITTVPHSNNFIAGIVNLRGEIMVVLHLAELIKMRDAEEPAPDIDNCQLVRLQIHDENLILIVDSVEDIISLAEDDKEPASGRLEDAVAEHITEIGHYNEEMVLFLEPVHLFQTLKEK